MACSLVKRVYCSPAGKGVGTNACASARRESMLPAQDIGDYAWQSERAYSKAVMLKQ